MARTLNSLGPGNKRVLREPRIGIAAPFYFWPFGLYKNKVCFLHSCLKLGAFFVEFKALLKCLHTQ